MEEWDFTTETSAILLPCEFRSIGFWSNKYLLQIPDSYIGVKHLNTFSFNCNCTFKIYMHGCTDAFVKWIFKAKNRLQFRRFRNIRRLMIAYWHSLWLLSSADESVDAQSVLREMTQACYSSFNFHSVTIQMERQADLKPDCNLCKDPKV